MTYPPKVHLWEILVRPSLWMRNYPVDKDFDRWLSDAMDRGEPFRLCTLPPTETIYEIEMAGLQIWIMNSPYADATTPGQIKHSASRRTALRLRRATEPVLRARSKFQPPTSTEPA